MEGFLEHKQRFCMVRNWRLLDKCKRQSAIFYMKEFLKRSFRKINCNSLLSDIPDDVCSLIASYVIATIPTVGKLYWHLKGDKVMLSPDNRTATFNPDEIGLDSGSVLANRSFDIKGKHAVCIYVNHADKSVGGCRYIGVVDSTTVGLNSNLQVGASGHRVAWDGFCSKIYTDIQGYNFIVASSWVTGDSIQLVIDCDEKEISFYKNNLFIATVSVKDLGYKAWTPVIGFGTIAGQSFTLCSYCNNFYIPLFK